MKFDFDWNYINAGAPYVTVSELGLAFNSPSSVLLGDPEEVVIGFDQDKMTIGIMDAKNISGAKTYAFHSRMRAGWIRIGCKEFVKYLSSISRIKFSPAKRFVARYDKEEQLLFVTIREEEIDNEKTQEATNE